MGETFWTVDLTYRPRFEPPDLASGVTGRRGPVFVTATAGYGSFRWNVAGGVATSAGFGFGFDATVLLGSPARGGRVALLVDYTTFPSNAFTSPSGSGTGQGSLWSVAIHYKLPRKMAAGPTAGTVYVSTVPNIPALGAEWDLTGGFTSLTLPGSTYQWTGFFVGVGKTF